MIGNVRKKGVRESLGYGSLVAPSVLNGLLYVSVPGNRISDFIEKYGVVASGNPRNRLLRELLLIGTRLVRERSVHHTSRGGVKVTVTSRKVASEESRVPTSALESELDLFWLFFPRRLVLTSGSGYTQREQRVPVPMILGTSSRIL